MLLNTSHLPGGKPLVMAALTEFAMYLAFAGHDRCYSGPCGCLPSGACDVCLSVKPLLTSDLGLILFETSSICII